MDASGRRRGHRLLPHTADVIVEAWGDDLPACVEEAVLGLAETYADARRATEAERAQVHVPAGPDESLLLAALDEMIFLLDTSPNVPVSATVTAAEDGGLDLAIVLATHGTVEATGAAPKAISRSELAVVASANHVRCRYLVDV